MDLPLLSGIDIKDYIERSPPLQERAIPFIFINTSCNLNVVMEAYKFSIQGYFLKPENYQELKDKLATIFKYWKACLHPKKGNLRIAVTLKAREKLLNHFTCWDYYSILPRLSANPGVSKVW